MLAAAPATGVSSVRGPVLPSRMVGSVRETRYGVGGSRAARLAAGPPSRGHGRPQLVSCAALPPLQHERLRPSALRGALLLPVHRVRQRGGGEGGPAALLAEGRLLLRVSAAGRDAGPPGLEGVAAAASPRFLRAESLDGGRSAVHVRGTRLVASCVVGGHGAPVRGRGAWSARRSHAPVSNRECSLWYFASES